jgi:hypothetical protein
MIFSAEEGEFFDFQQKGARSVPNRDLDAFELLFPFYRFGTIFSANVLAKV